MPNLAYLLRRPFPRDMSVSDSLLMVKEKMMAEEKKISEEAKAEEKRPIERIFEQPPDAISFYSDLGQVLETGHEVVMQFYEAIPGPPDMGGRITKVRTRLRATITVSHSHALNLGKLLVERASKVGK